MPTIEELFEHELEISRKDASAGLQFHYAYLGIHATLNHDDDALRRVNENGLFWKTVDGALHTSAFITLGRRFDQKSPHNIDKLVGIAERNIQIFSKPALEARKRKIRNAGEWIAEYMNSVYVPNKTDFRELRKFVDIQRKIYNEKYKPIRDKIHAHLEIAEDSDIQALYAATNIVELSKLFGSLLQVYDVLWELYENGRKPDWSPKVYSVENIVQKVSKHNRPSHLPERIVVETRDVLRSIGHR